MTEANSSPERRLMLLLGAISRAQSRYMASAPPDTVFGDLLETVLEVTDSEYGFIGEVEERDTGPVLRTHAITDIAWDDHSRELYERMLRRDLVFSNMNTLFGAAMTGGEVVIANDPASDSRAGGLPDGHPRLEAFLGIPFLVGAEVVGMVGVANRPGGYDEGLVEFIAPFVTTCTRLVEGYQERARRARAEADHSISEKRFRSLLDQASDAIFVATPAGRYTSVNPAACALLGYTEHELVQKNLRDLIPAGDLELRPLRLTELKKGASLITERRLIHKEGHLVEVELSATVLEDGSLLAIGRDVTERNRLRAKLAQADRMATVGTLAAGVAHEVNNPLTYLLLHLDGLTAQLGRLETLIEGLRGGDDGTQAELLEALQAFPLSKLREHTASAIDGSERVRDIVRDLKTFSWAGAEEEAFAVDVHHSLEAALRLAGNEIRHRGSVVRDFDKVPPVTAIEGRLAQVFLNLLLNAADALDGVEPTRPRQIRVRTWTEGEKVVVSVEDTGVGIAPESLPRVFDAFYTTKAAGVGSGLGLAVSRDIIESFGGKIEVSSIVGEGTTFQVVLPSAGEREQTPAPRKAPTEITAGPRRRVLLVDDEPLVAGVLARVLQRHHEVEVATSGAEARDRLREDDGFDVILCDVMMPGMSGMDLHAWMARERPSLLPRLAFMSGGAFTGKARSFIDSLSSPLLVKPFTASTVLELVETVASNAE